MCHLILVRHSESRILPGIPANQWPLTEEGRRRCKPLAENLAKWKPKRIITSVEPKAKETGQLVAQRLCLPFETAPDLHEHERSSVGLADRVAFLAHIETLFARPDECVFGDESAAQALARFERAISTTLKSHPGESIAIVTHGTVLALFVARMTNQNAFVFWQRLGQPAFIVFELPQMALSTVEVVL